jgi:excisionase family DNA binding protein
MEKQLFTYDEAAVFLGCCIRTIHKIIERGEIEPSYVSPRCPRIRRVDLNGFVANRVHPRNQKITKRKAA